VVSLLRFRVVSFTGISILKMQNPNSLIDKESQCWWALCSY
jgi:hypothetical protein